MIDAQTIAVCLRELEKTASAHVDRLAGGTADRLRPTAFNRASLRRGTRHEMEHTKLRGVATEIAMDHLAEDPKYYRKLEQIEKGAEEPVGFFKGMGDFAKNPVSEAKKGWHATRNDHPLQKKFLADEIKDSRHHVSDIETNKGMAGKLRKGGWLANYGKYMGPSKLRKGLNTAARHLPGGRSMAVLGTVGGLHGDLKKVDPITGRKRGVGERAGGAALGAAAGLAGMRHGPISGIALSVMGGAAGRALGRQGDRLAGKAHELVTKRKAQ